MRRVMVHGLMGFMAAMGVAGCETGSGVLLGGSLAKGRLYSEAEARVLALDKQAAPGCEARSIVGVRLIDRPASAATDFDRMYSVGLPDVSRGVQTPSARPSSASTVTDGFTERWIVDRCGQRAAYRVTFSTGDIVEVVPEPQTRRKFTP